MGDWRSRAEPVDPPPTGGSWRERAEPAGASAPASAADAPGFLGWQPPTTPEPEGQALPQVGRLEALRRGVQQGFTSGWSDEARGPAAGWPDEERQALEWLVQQHGTPEELAEIQARPSPQEEMRDRQRAALKQHPATYVAGEIGGGVAQSAAIPALRPTSGMAGFAKEAALGAAAGAGVADGDVRDRVGGAALGGAIGGGVYGASRAVPAAVRTAKDLAVRGQTAALDEATQDIARRYTASSPEGKVLREQARRGSTSMDPTITEVTDRLSRQEEIRDIVQDYASIGLKHDVIEGAMDAVPPPGRWDAESSDAVTDALGKVVGMMEHEAERLPAGRLALRRAAEAIETFGQIKDTPAETYRRLDELKRRIGKQVKASSRGANADHAAAEALQDVYEGLRAHLERADVWGEATTDIQREINRAWVPAIQQRPRFERELLTEAGAPSVDPWSTRPEGDPSKVGGLMRGLGKPETALRERVLREGLQSEQDLMSAMGKHMDAPEDIATLIQEGQQNVKHLQDLIERSRHDLVAANELRELMQVKGPIPMVPGPGRIAGMQSTAERLGQQVTEKLGAAGDVAGQVPRGVRQAGAALAGRSRAASGIGETLASRVQSIATERPELLGPYADMLLNALEEGGHEAVAVQHEVLSQTDPEYQDRMREIEREEQEANR